MVLLFETSQISHPILSDVRVKSGRGKTPGPGQETFSLFELMDIKVFPCQAAILEFMDNLSVLVPPQHRDVDHARFVTLLYPGRKIGQGFRRGFHRQVEPDHMLHDGEMARLGTPIKTDGFDAKITQEVSEVLIEIVPLALRSPDHTERCRRAVS